MDHLQCYIQHDRNWKLHQIFGKMIDGARSQMKSG